MDTGVKMRLNGLITGALVVIAMCSVTSAIQEANVYRLCESNVTMNLTSNFRLIPDDPLPSASGVFMQGFSIIGTGEKGFASLIVVDIYNEKMNMIDPASISDMMTNAILSASSDTGYSAMDNILGNWTAIGANGANATVETISTKGSAFSIFGPKADIAFWPIKDQTYFCVCSSFDKNITEQMINTLEIT